jgi:transposase-like protein
MSENIIARYSPRVDWDLRMDFNSFVKHFDEIVKNELDAVEFVRKALEKAGPLRCDHCESANLKHAYGSRNSTCEDCGSTSSFTKGTLFSSAKKVRHHIACIALIQANILTSQAAFGRAFKVSQSTAWATFHSVADVVRANMSERLFVSTSIKFLDLFLKRSKETHRGMHPISEEDSIREALLAEKQTPNAEETRSDARSGRFVGDEAVADANGETTADDESGAELGAEARIGMNMNDTGQKEADTTKDTIGASNTIQKGSMDEMDVSNLSADEEGDGDIDFYRVSESQAVLLEALRHRRRHLFDLCKETGFGEEKIFRDLVMLEIMGRIRSDVGNWFEISRGPSPMEILLKNIEELSADQQNVISRLISLIRSVHHGISRKYLQNYLAVYWCMNDRETWANSRLWRVVVDAEYPRARELTAYVTPPTVQFLLSSLC